MSQFLLFSGSSHPTFSQEVATYLGLPLSPVKFEHFPDGELSCQILENVRGRDVFVIQTIARDPNNYLMELLILVDALKRASAKSIAAVIPYFGYARQDRKDKPRVPITAKLVADLLTTAGVTRILTMDLHAGQIQGFFNIPVDNLYARPILADGVKSLLQIKNFVVMAPDLGAIKKARSYANHLHADYALIDKRRVDIETVEVAAIIGNVKGRDVILVDDMCSTGDTLIKAALACKKEGAQRIFAVFSHPLLVGQAVKNIFESPIEAVITSNTVPLQKSISSPRLHVLSVATLFGEAIRCVMSAESISSTYTGDT